MKTKAQSSSANIDIHVFRKATRPEAGFGYNHQRSLSTGAISLQNWVLWGDQKIGRLPDLGVPRIK